MKIFSKTFSALAVGLALASPTSIITSLALPLGAVILTAGEVSACNDKPSDCNPTPPPVVVPEPEPVPVVVHNGSGGSARGVAPCDPNPGERKLYDEVLEDDLVRAYDNAYAKEQWAHVWVQNGQIVDLVQVGEAGPDGATVWQLTKEPFVDDNRACVKPYHKGSMKVQGIQW